MAIVAETNISGRAIGVLLKEKPFLYMYPDGIQRLSYDPAQLVLSDNVNMWSLKKPILLAGDNIDRSNNNWCAGVKGDYGIHIGARNNLDTGSGRDLSVKKWVRDKPTVDKVYPARMADFGGYNHAAKPPIYLQQPEGSEIKVNPYIYRFSIPFTTGEIPLNMIDLSSSTGWDKNKLRLMLVCTTTGLRFHCRTLLKDMTATADYEFENQYSALLPATTYSFRAFIAQYATEDLYSATGDGTTIFNDNVYTLTDQTVKCKSMADIEAENPTNTFARYIETRNLYYKTNTPTWQSVMLSGTTDDPATAADFVDINNFDPYRGSVVFKLKFNCPDNVFTAATFRNSGLRSVTPMLNYAGDVGFNKQFFSGNVMRLYRSFNKLNGDLSGEWTDADGYITRDTILYAVVPSRVYMSDLSPQNIKAVRTSIAVFFSNSESVCSATIYVKSDSQAQVLPTPSWKN